MVELKGQQLLYVPGNLCFGTPASTPPTMNVIVYLEPY